MKNTFGNAIQITLFGESHGPCVGAVVDGLAPGIPVDQPYMEKLLSRRRPAGAISTARQEPDPIIFESGVYNGFTTGTPVCIRIPNMDVRSNDYEATHWLPRPSHADYTAYCKYHGFEDPRGGGHFSGRITAALVAVGGLLIPALEAKGIRIGTHILRCGTVCDRPFVDVDADAAALCSRDFAVLDEAAGDKMMDAIQQAKAAGDSLGGILETVVIGLTPGVGEPWFDTLEGLLSHALFSIPAVKGVEFGAGFSLAEMTGSQANDSFCMCDDKVITVSNNSGGINGGISNGMPLVFRCAVRPTPTISKPQATVDMKQGKDAVLTAAGRHDPCIVHRARVVADCMTAFVLADALTGRFGTDWLVEK